MSRPRRAALPLFLLLIACTSMVGSPSRAQTAAFDMPALARVSDRTRVLFPQTAHWFRIVATQRFTIDDESRLVPDYGSLMHARVRREDGAGHTIQPRFAPTFDAPTRIASGQLSGMYIDLVPVEARPAQARIEDGLVVYPDAFDDTDVLLKATPTHTDEYLVLRSTRAPCRWRYLVRRGPAAAMLRQAGTSVEVADANGAAWLRASRPIAVDARGARATGSIRVDEHGDLVLAIDLAGLAPPILVDPDWSATGDMSYGRFYGASALLADGRVFMTGGCSQSVCSGDLAPSACQILVGPAEALDLTSRTWSVVATESVPRFFHGAQTLADGRVLVAGGCTNTDCSTQTTSAEIFDPASNAFHATASLAEPRVASSVITLADGRVMFAGGCTPAGCTSHVELYDRAATAPRRVADLHFARARAQTVLLSSGHVLVVGGCADFRCTSVLASAEIYDPVSDSWTQAAPMSTARAGHFAVPLADGRALVGGGCADTSCSTFLSSTEFFDPGAMRFSRGPDLREARLGARALLLPDGHVMVSQGCSGHATCDLTNEMFDPVSSAFAYIAPALTTRAFHEFVLDRPAREVVAIGGCQPGTCSWWNETFDVSAFMSPADSGVPFDAAIDGQVFPNDAGGADFDGSQSQDGACVMDASTRTQPASCGCVTAGAQQRRETPWTLVLTALASIAWARRRRRKRVCSPRVPAAGS